MKFDVIRFLDDYNISYSTLSKNVSQNFVGLQCPFCSDRSDHLGIHRTEGMVSCWKCGKHGLFETIEMLAGETPSKIVKKYSNIEFSNDFDKIINLKEKRNVPNFIKVPGRKEFKEGHRKYLIKREFDPDYVIHKYDLRVTYGNEEYPHRIIFPIMLGGKIVSYQGRTYIGAEPKYLTCHPDKEIVFHKDTFFNIDNCNNTSVLITEGVFDVLRLGDNCMASFGTAITPYQLNLIRNKFSRVFLLYDSEPEAQAKAKKALYTLNACGVITEKISLEKGDPGDMTDEEAIYLKKELYLI